MLSIFQSQIQKWKLVGFLCIFFTLYFPSNHPTNMQKCVKYNGSLKRVLFAIWNVVTKSLLKSSECELTMKRYLFFFICWKYKQLLHLIDMWIARTCVTQYSTQTNNTLSAQLYASGIWEYIRIWYTLILLTKIHFENDSNID